MNLKVILVLVTRLYLCAPNIDGGRLNQFREFVRCCGGHGDGGRLRVRLAVPKFWYCRIVMITLCNEASNIELRDNTIVTASITAENM